MGGGSLHFRGPHRPSPQIVLADGRYRAPRDRSPAHPLTDDTPITRGGWGENKDWIGGACLTAILIGEVLVQLML